MQTLRAGCIKVEPKCSIESDTLL